MRIRVRRCIASLGPVPAAIHGWRLIRSKVGPERRPHRRWSKRARHPVWARPGTTDVHVFDQVFVRLDYEVATTMASPSLILDCGANVGYASAFFLSRFPEAEVIAIEPDADNFAMLERNLAPYGSRARAVQAGVWSHPTSLRVVEAPDGEAGAWAFQVRESPTGGPDTVPGVSIGDLLARSGHSRISLLKMDIEGAEAVVFARGADEWLPSVDDIIIELHDDTAFGPATEAFLRAIADHDFEVSHPRELTYCRRRGRTASS